MNVVSRNTWRQVTDSSNLHIQTCMYNYGGALKRTKEQAEQTKNQILDSAVKVFSNKGFNAARLTDIAESAGVTRGAVYWHFRDKSEIFEAVSEKFFGEYLQLIEGVDEKNLTPIQKVEEILWQVLARSQENQNMFKIMRAQVLFFERIGTSIEDAFPNIDAILKKLTHQIQKIIANGQTAGELRTDISPAGMAAYIQALIKGLSDIALGKYFAIDLIENARPMIGILIDGLRKKN